FFNSYDINLIEHVKDLINAGITSLKIEGRAKSVYYVATVTRAYRKVIDAIGKNEYKKIISEQKKELDKLTNRGYSKGFLLESEPLHDFFDRNRNANFDFVGEVVGDPVNNGKPGNFNLVRVHNSLFQKDRLEAITPEGNFPVKILEMRNNEDEIIEEAHGGDGKKYLIKFDKKLNTLDIIRRMK
ncbi:MAG TPA: U32 family peptidase, partial [Patescibacteria group bacterium]|nr:U32 family peptidase [Patescibacteria group bacterium]